MPHRPQRRDRPGFTLLEVVLATTIAVLLLGALYVAVNMQLQYAQTSRDIIEESTLSRAILARMDADAAHTVGLCDPARFRLAASPTAAAATTGASTSGAATTTATSSTGTSSGGTSASGSTTSTTGDGAAANIVLPLGVEGDSETLHLFVSNLPREIYASGASFNGNDDGDLPPVVSDLRRVSYWLAGGDDSPTGLARQEVSLVTSDDALQNLPPGIDDEDSFVIADEVRSLNFQYFDGTEWQDSWDSTTPGADGVTPIGSPLAIAVTIGIVQPHGLSASQGDGALKTYRHVLLIPSANGATLQSQNQTGGATAGSQPSQSMNGGGAAP